MARILISGDWHLSDNPRDEYRHKWQIKLRRLIKELEIDELFVLGDITDSKNYHGSHLVNRMVQHFVKLSRIVPVTILTGNHDYDNPTEPFFQFLGELDNILWINTPEKLHSLGKLKHLFVPHTRTPAETWEPFLKEKVDWIFAHQCFEGATNEQGRVMGGAHPDLLPAGATIIAGDIHVPQKFKNVIYVGAPYTIKFGDSFKPRVLVLDTETGKLTSVPCGGAQKALVVVESVKELQAALEKQTGSKDVIKVRIRCTDIGGWNALKEEALKVAASSERSIHTIEPVLEKKRANNRGRALIRKATTDSELLDGYGKRHNVPDQTLETGKTLVTDQ